MDLFRWTCRCGITACAEEEDKAQSDATDHVFQAHQINSLDIIAFDIFKDAAQAAATEAQAAKDAEILGISPAQLVQDRKVAVPPPKSEESK